MRVLQVYRDYFTRVPGGIERHVHQLAHGLDDVADVEVLVSSGKRRSEVIDDAGVTVHMLGEMTRWQGLSFSPSMVRWLRASRYDVVHVHSPYPMGEMAVALARVRAARVATYHADLDRGARLMPAYRRFLRLAYARYDRVLVSSEQLVERSPVVSALHQRRPDVVRVIPFGVDTERYSPEQNDRARSLRDSWGPGPIVLFLGRLRYYKGLHILIRAMEKLDAKLVVVGTGPMRSHIVPMGRAYLGDRFLHVHRVDDDEVPDFYRAADIFCLPSTSRAEAFGISTVEAMATGLPVVTTDVGTGTSVVNVNERTGLVVPPRDVEGLRFALDRLLADETLRATLGRQARERALGSFGLETMLGRIADVYAEVGGRA